MIEQPLASLISLTNKPAQNKEERTEAILRMMEKIFEEAGGTYYEDVGELYRRFDKNDLLVRREQPIRLLEAFANRQDLHVEYDPTVGRPYANAARWRFVDGSKGLQNAFLEGQTDLQGVVTVVGFEKGKDLSLNEISSEPRGGSGLDRDYVRSIQGDIHPADVRFVILRVPASRLPERELTEKELERFEENPKMHVFRGFSFEHAAN